MTVVLFCFLALACQFAFGQENTCASLVNCISTQQGGNGGPNSNQLRQRQRLGTCGRTEIDQMANMMDQLSQKRQERSTKVQQCIQGQNLGSSGFPGCTLPTGNIRRSCGRRGNNRGGNRACSQYKCGCPEARICHECYETSSLHDQIHGLKLQLDTMRLQCTADLPQNRNSRGPQQDESMVFALSD